VSAGKTRTSSSCRCAWAQRRPAEGHRETERQRARPRAVGAVAQTLAARSAPVASPAPPTTLPLAQALDHREMLRRQTAQAAQAAPGHRQSGSGESHHSTGSRRLCRPCAMSATFRAPMTTAPRHSRSKQPCLVRLQTPRPAATAAAAATPATMTVAAALMTAAAPAVKTRPILTANCIRRTFPVLYVYTIGAY
jgi:hypothetical protein